jgi:lysophospholipase L1-like esterase
MRNLRTLNLATTLALGLWLAAASVAGGDFAKWEKDIAAFEAEDARQPPPHGAVLFTGSSSIRMWTNLAADLPELTTLRRGFGGSQMVDLLHFTDRLVLPYRPSKLFVYEGDNDLAAGVPPAELARLFKQFVRRVHAALPATDIYYIAVKPSPSRWFLSPQAQEANAAIAAYARRAPRVHFVDIRNPMLGPDGRPNPSLFLEDRLHMNAQGYAIWTREIRHALSKS